MEATAAAPPPGAAAVAEILVETVEMPMVMVAEEAVDFSQKVEMEPQAAEMEAEMEKPLVAAEAVMDPNPLLAAATAATAAASFFIRK